MTHGSSPTPSKTFYTTILTSEDGQTGIELKAASDKARLVVIAGEPLDQEIVQHGVCCSLLFSRSQLILSTPPNRSFRHGLSRGHHEGVPGLPVWD